MKKELGDKVEEYWTCDRCEIDSLGDSMCPCPIGSCDALCMGEVVTSKTIYFNETTWYYQYLHDEDTYYLSEHHPIGGILTELFYDNYQDLMDYAAEHQLLIQVKNG